MQLNATFDPDIFDTAYNESVNRISIYVENSILNFLIRDKNDRDHLINATVSLNANKLQHIAARWNLTHMSLYINNTIVAGNYTSDEAQNDTNTLLIEQFETESKIK